MKINDEIVLHPRNYDGSVFEMLPSSKFRFSSKLTSWGNTTSTFAFINKIMYIPLRSNCKSYNKSSIDTIISNIDDDVYINNNS